MLTDLIIIGTGDFADVAHQYLAPMYRVVAFSEEAEFRARSEFKGIPVVDFQCLDSSKSYRGAKVLVAVGPNRVNTVRERLFHEVIDRGFSCINYVHPSATVCESAQLGSNCFLFPGVVVEPSVTIGDNCVLWSNSTVAHHSVIESHVFMAPGAMVSGRSKVERNCFLGINCTVRDHIVVGEKSIIGAGVVVKGNLAAGSVLSANPGTALEQSAMDTKI